MRKDLRKRREETWDLFAIKGLDYGDVVERLAEKYDVAEGTIESDIHRMDNWLPKLDETSQRSGVSRMRELQKNRQRLQQMALEARRDGDLSQELEIRRQIDRSAERHINLSQSLGLTDEVPDEIKHSGEIDGEQTVTINHVSAEDLFRESEE